MARKSKKIDETMRLSGVGVRIQPSTVSCHSLSDLFQLVAMQPPGQGGNPAVIRSFTTLSASLAKYSLAPGMSSS